MSPLTYGHCGNCWEFNAYDRTRCHHCNEVLAWAFLIDPALEESNERPSLWALLTGRQEIAKEKHKVRCLYCDGLIPYDTKVCFHCRRLIATGSKWGAVWYGPTFDPDAPTLRQLVDAYIERHLPA
ncbi:hypothetical protein EON83_21910 [bacterium]|nr:MAG: hypothetical protein EON83_21910 [bacterium]